MRMNLDAYYASSITKLANHLKVSTSGTKDDKIQRILDTGLTEEKLKELEGKLELKLTKTAKQRRSKKRSRKRSTRTSVQVAPAPELTNKLEKLTNLVQNLEKQAVSFEKQLFYLLGKISDLDLAYEQQANPKKDLERVIDEYRDAIMRLLEDKEQINIDELYAKIRIDPIEERYLERALQDLVNDEFIALKEGKSEEMALGRYGLIELL